MFHLWPPDLLNPPPRVQIYSLCSWFSLMYLDHASIIDLFRDWCVPRWRFPLSPFRWIAHTPALLCLSPPL